MNKRASFIAILAMATLAGAAPTWKINRTSDGTIRNLTVDNPISTLGIERSFEVEVNASGVPTRGTVSFTNGFKRDLKDGEMSLAWIVYGGHQVMWEYWKDQGQVVTLGQNQVPTPGKATHIITQGDIEYFGKIAGGPARFDQFVLDIDGSNITFDKAPLKVLEQLK
jgi:hypothetical protein